MMAPSLSSTILSASLQGPSASTLSSSAHSPSHFIDSSPHHPLASSSSSSLAHLSAAKAGDGSPSSASPASRAIPFHLSGPNWMGPNMDFGDGHSLSSFSIGRFFGATVCAMTSATQRTVGIFVSPRFALVQVLSFPTETLTALAWSPQCLVLAVATSERAISLFYRSEVLPRRLHWSLHEDRPTQAKRFFPCSFPITALAFRPSDSALLIGGAQGQLELWTCNLAKQHQCQGLPRAKLNSIAPLPPVPQDTLIWERDGERLSHSQGAVIYLAFSPDSKLFASKIENSRFLHIWFKLSHESYDATSARLSMILMPPALSTSSSSSSSFSSSSSAMRHRVKPNARGDENGWDMKQVRELQQKVELRIKKAEYQYTLLPHPVDLNGAHISWFPFPHHCPVATHMLFTYSSDRQLRFWSQAQQSPSAFPSFQLVHVLDARQLDFLSFSWLFPPVHSSFPFPKESYEFSNATPDLPSRNVAQPNPSQSLPLTRNLTNTRILLTSRFVGVHRDGSTTLFEFKDNALHLLSRSPPFFDAALDIHPDPASPPSPTVLFAESGSAESEDLDLFLCISGRFFYSGHSASCFMATNPSASSQRRTLTVGRPGSTQPITQFVSVFDPISLKSLYLSISGLLKPPLLWAVNPHTSSGFPFNFHPLPDACGTSPATSISWFSPSFFVCAYTAGNLSLFRLDHENRVPSILHFHEVDAPAEFSSSTTIATLVILSFPADTLQSPSISPAAPTNDLSNTTFGCCLGMLADGTGLIASKILPFSDRFTSPEGSPPSGRSTWSIITQFTGDNLVRSMALSPTLSQQRTPISLFTGHQQGMVRLWSVQPLIPVEDSELIAQPLLSISFEQLTRCFSTGSTPVDFIEPAYFGRLATLSRGRAAMKIWELESSVPFYKLEWEYIDPSELKQTVSPLSHVSPLVSVAKPAAVSPDERLLLTDWYILPSRSFILAVAREDTFFLLYPQYPNICQAGGRDSMAENASVNFKPWGQWTIDRIQYGLITQIKWTSDAGLIVLCGETSLYYPSEFLAASMSRINPLHTSIHFPKSLMSSIPQTFTHEISSPLPHFHPSVLLQHIVSNQTLLITEILTSLKHQLHRHRQLLIDEGANFKVPLIVELFPIRRWFELALQDDIATSSSKGGPASESAQRSQNIDALFAPPDLDNPDHAAPAGLVESQLDSEYEVLTDITLSKLTRPEQMALLAAVTAFTQTRSQYQSLDRCAFQFLISLKMTTFLQKFKLHSALDSSDFAWAIQSESQEALVKAAFSQAQPSWELARSTGMGYWIKSLTLLRSTVETIAQATYMKDKEPGDAALWYLALDKRRALSALFKLKGNKSLAEFLAKDPSLPDNRRIACSNAYDQLSKRRYYTALAFFVLAGSLKDVIHTCLTKLEDFQLAMVLIRLVTKNDSSEMLTDLVLKQLIPHAIETRDTWLHHIALWTLKRYPDSLEILLPPTNDLSNLTPTDAGSWSPVAIDYIQYLITSTILKNSPVDLKRIYFLRRRIAYCFFYAGFPSFSLLLYTEVKKYREDPASTQLKHSTALLPVFPQQSSSAASPQGERATEDRASDLFGTSNPSPAGSSDRADDLFGNSNPSSSSDRASDLFGNSTLSPTPSSDRASDLFGGGSHSFSFASSPPPARASDLFGGPASPPPMSFSSFNSMAFSFADDEDPPEPEFQLEAEPAPDPSVPSLDLSDHIIQSMDQWQQTQVCLALVSLLFQQHELLSRFPYNPHENSTEVGAPDTPFALSPKLSPELSDMLDACKTRFDLDNKTLRFAIQSFLDGNGFFRLSHWFQFHFHDLMDSAEPLQIVSSMQHYKSELKHLEDFVLSQLELHSWVPIFYSNSHAASMLSKALDLLFVYPHFAMDPIISEFFSLNLITSTRLLAFLIVLEFQEWMLAPLIFVPRTLNELIPLILHIRHAIDPSLTIYPVAYSELCKDEIASDIVMLNSFERKAGLGGKAKMLQYAEYALANALITLVAFEVLMFDGQSKETRDSQKLFACLRRFDQCLVTALTEYYRTFNDARDALHFVWQFQTNCLSIVSNWIGRAASSSVLTDPWETLLLNTSPTAPSPRIGPTAIVRVDRTQCLFWTHMVRSYSMAFPYVVERSLRRWTPLHASWFAAHQNFHIGVSDGRLVYPSSQPAEAGHSIVAGIVHALKASAAATTTSSSSIPSASTTSSTNASTSASSTSSPTPVSIDLSSRFFPLPAAHHIRPREAFLYRPQESLPQLTPDHEKQQPQDFTCFKIKGIVHGMAFADQCILAATTVGVHELGAFDTHSNRLALRCVGRNPEVVQSLVLHPTRPFYATGGTSGEITFFPTSMHGRSGMDSSHPLSPVELAEPLRRMRKELGSSHRINRIRFNASGTMLGAVDRSGNFSIWYPDASINSSAAGLATPFVNAQVHSKQASDFLFLDDAGLTATVGIQKSNGLDLPNLSLWDWCLPPHKASVCSFGRKAVLTSGGSSLAYSPSRRWLAAGGRDGVLNVFDLRKPDRVFFTHAHDNNIRSLAIHPASERVLISGSSDGSVLAFNLPTLNPIGCWLNLHPRSSFVSPPNSTGIFSSTISTIGTTEVGFFSDFILSCGSDGRIDAKRIFQTLPL